RQRSSYDGRRSYANSQNTDGRERRRARGTLTGRRAVREPRRVGRDHTVPRGVPSVDRHRQALDEVDRQCRGRLDEASTRGGGPALITRSGSAYKETVGRDVGLTDFGAAVSLCTRYSFTPNIGLRFRAEDFIYRAKLGYENSANPSENLTLGARTQHDFVLSA